MKFFRLCLLLIILIIASTPIFAEEIQLTQWDYFKDIYGRGNGNYNAIFLDEDIYYYAASDLADLRIVDDHNQFVSYYIQHDVIPKKLRIDTHSTQFISQYSIGENYFAQFRVLPLKNKTGFLANLLTITLNEKKFAYTVQIYGSQDSIRWDYITKASVYKIGAFEKSEIPLGADHSYPYYQIKFLNAQNGVTVSKINLLYDQNETRQNSYTKNVAFETTTTGKTTTIHLPLRSIANLQINRINLDITDSFNRDYKVYTVAQDGSRKLLCTGNFYKVVLQDFEISKTNIDFDPLLSSQPIQIEIYNKDDRPLAINKVQVKYFTDKLVFPKTSSLTYRIFFGNRSVTKPEYDLESFKLYTEEEPQNPCTLGEIQDAQTAVNSSQKISIRESFIIFSGITLTFVAYQKFSRKIKIPFLNRYR